MTTPAVLEKQSFLVREIKWETPSTFTLVLAPESGAMFSFAAGQWVYLYLLNEDGSSWARAAFSIASAPEEAQKQFELGIKIYGDFTKRASKLMPDDHVQIQGPFGVFTLHENISPLVMFAGGIGVTPFRSQIRSLWKRRSATQVYLFYSNKIVEETAYFEELQAMAKEWPALHVIFLLTSEAPAKWPGETGRLNLEIIKRHVPSLDQGEFLMCGPPGFMDSIKAILDTQGVDTKKRLRKELFG
ncbi:FAD-dependent oxidoreductase [Candidatus Uhrbacteria bacterium]|nr:FAD-dependent oxidoreductase [Candidatus Uhrbacteria bacterium]